MFGDNFHQPITFWRLLSGDGSGGFLFDVPKHFTARWEERQEQFMDVRGELTNSKAVVFVRTAMDIGDYLFLGGSVARNPDEEPNTHVIRGIVNTPDLNGIIMERRVLL